MDRAFEFQTEEEALKFVRKFRIPENGHSTRVYRGVGWNKVVVSGREKQLDNWVESLKG